MADTKPMPGATLRALRGSIKKWEAIVAGDGRDLGSANCPLCQLHHKDNCRGCPVAYASRRACCENTPHEAWVGAAIATGGATAPISHRDPEHRAELTRLAQAELDFLRSLLPEGEAP